MSFAFSEEQTMLRDTVDRVVREQHSFQDRRAAIASSAGWPRNFWRLLGELGILGASLPDEVGGLGGGAIETMLIMQALGKGLVTSPYVPTIVCAANLIARAGSRAQREAHLPAILRGDRIFAFACSEESDEGDLLGSSTVAFYEDGNYRISGRKSLVVGASWADWMIAVARVAGAPNELCAFTVPMTSPGLSVVTRQTIDGGMASEITFDNVVVEAGAMIGSPVHTRAVLEQIIDEATVALCADAVGAIDALLWATVTYAKTRKQFGRPIASFQALQHRMVDMLIARDQASSITHLASRNLSAEAGVRRRAVSAAKVHIGRLGRRTAQAAVQLHGGIGITDELDVSHYFRRLEVIELQFGNTDFHLRRYGHLLDETAPLWEAAMAEAVDS